MHEPDPPTFGQRLTGEDYQWRPGAYGIVLDDQGRVAVMRIPRGYFLPGGGMDAGETPETALAREIREECGRGVRILNEVGVAMQYVGAPGEGYFAKRCVFTARPWTEPRKRPSNTTTSFSGWRRKRRAGNSIMRASRGRWRKR